MLEFEDLVYLDVQKTGSTYVRAFLQAFAATREIADRKHRPVDHREAGKLYVISSRDPLQQYLSLFAFGCQKMGGLRKRLIEAGKGEFYDGTIHGFEKWLELILDPVTGQKYLSKLDNHKILDLVGLQSLRFLTLALPSPFEHFETFHGRGDVANSLKTDGLMDVLLKQETLITDLRKLAFGKHRDRFRKPFAAKRFLVEEPRLNTSKKLRIDPSALSPETLHRVEEREWLFFDALHYEPYVSSRSRA